MEPLTRTVSILEARMAVVITMDRKKELVAETIGFGCVLHSRESWQIVVYSKTTLIF